MMSEDASSVPSNLRASSLQLQHPNSNSNPNPNPNSASSVKRKRSLPGTPDPNAEVIALSPKSLMATNRFICEVCNKGFQRDQNLQLHRRGHNLPWKLRQRSKEEEVRKKVYVCPEKSCVHHDPCRALGDLTGIKKHFSRKHGEKKWRCEKCSKKYAVQSDWKAHNKICGTRQYKCDCGTIFSRKDSFVTHRAFCDAMAEQAGRVTSLPAVLSNEILMNAQGSRVMPQGLQYSEFGGPVPESFMGNFADASHHHEHNKLKLPLWLDQANPHALSVGSNSSVFSPEPTNMFGTPPQCQWMNYRSYPETSSFNGAVNNVSMAQPQGVIMKLEQEENKGELLSNTLFPFSHMESSRISGNGNNSAFENSNTVFGLLDPSISSSNNIQKMLFKDGENLNQLVNSQASSNMNMVMMPRIEEMMEKQLQYSNSSEEHLTKDFMGVGDGSLMGPVVNLQSKFRGHY
ncbi:hypothetical protein Fmac_019632 [Flemingia macrophylla]|uniref:C2H2-type domain-containing protein n=1 Tax=Flemingia macrophylla TaxID=520843 RepID=A0ABD1M8C3_9FABA